MLFRLAVTTALSAGLWSQISLSAARPSKDAWLEREDKTPFETRMPVWTGDG